MKLSLPFKVALLVGLLVSAHGAKQQRHGESDDYHGGKGKGGKSGKSGKAGEGSCPAPGNPHRKCEMDQVCRCQCVPDGRTPSPTPPHSKGKGGKGKGGKGGKNGKSGKTGEGTCPAPGNPGQKCERDQVCRCQCVPDGRTPSPTPPPRTPRPSPPPATPRPTPRPTPPPLTPRPTPPPRTPRPTPPPRTPRPTPPPRTPRPSPPPRTPRPTPPPATPRPTPPTPTTPMPSMMTTAPPTDTQTSMPTQEPTQAPTPFCACTDAHITYSATVVNNFLSSNPLEEVEFTCVNDNLSEANIPDGFEEFAGTCVFEDVDSTYSCSPDECTMSIVTTVCCPATHPCLFWAVQSSPSPASATVFVASDSPDPLSFDNSACANGQDGNTVTCTGNPFAVDAASHCPIEPTMAPTEAQPTPVTLSPTELE